MDKYTMLKIYEISCVSFSLSLIIMHFKQSDHCIFAYYNSYMSEKSN